MITTPYYALDRNVAWEVGRQMRHLAAAIAKHTWMWWQARSIKSRVVVLSVVAPLCAAGPADATIYGSNGENAGQYLQPAGVAVDSTTGNVYVLDRSADRVAEFSASGAFIRTWGWGVSNGRAEFEICLTGNICRIGISGGGAGQLSEPNGIVFDTQAGVAGELYVVDAGNRRVQAFSPEGNFVTMFGGAVNKNASKPNVCFATEECQTGQEGNGAAEFTKLGRFGEGPVAIAPDGNVYVGDKERVQVFEPNGTFVKAFQVSPSMNVIVRSLAITGSGTVYLTVAAASTNKLVPEVQEYSSEGSLEGTISLSGATTIWLSAGSTDLYIQEATSGSQQVLAFNGNRMEERSFPPPEGGSEESPGGIALVESGGTVSEILTASRLVVRCGRVPPPGPVVYKQTGTPEPGVRASVIAGIDPENHKTRYHFDYGRVGESNSEQTPAEQLAAEDFSVEVVTGKLEHLQPNTRYCFFVVAENSEGTVDGPEECFTSLPAVGVEGLAVSSVSANAVTFEVKLNPSGAATTYHFVYGATGKETLETGAMSAGSGSAYVAVDAHVQGLSSNTVYHYSVVASNKFGSAEVSRSFVTQPMGGSLMLLDNRAWEQVSPSVKHAAQFTSVPQEGGIIEASSSGEAITYLSYTGTEAEAKGEPAIEVAQILSRHGVAGWSSKDIATPHQGSWGPRVGEQAEYRGFAENLAGAIVEPPGGTPLSPLTTEQTPYLRREAKCAIVESASGECYLPVVTTSEVPAGVKFGESTEPLHFGAVRLAGGNRDLSAVVVKSAVGLVAGAGPANLYEWRNDHLSLVSELPGGGALAGCEAALGANASGAFAGTGLDSRSAVAPDGLQVAWSEDGCAGHLYLWEAGRGSTRVDMPQSGASGLNMSNAIYEDAVFENGRMSHVFFTDTQQLTANSTAGEGRPDLYDYSVSSGVMTDMTVALEGREHAGVVGVLPGVGQVSGTTYAYVVARGVLTSTPNSEGETAQPGEDNLYALEGAGGSWAPRLVAVLSGEDEHDWGNPGSRLGYLTSEVSPDGRWLAFMSDRSLTGYDNNDVVSGKADEEAYLYGVGSGRLVCASCDPSGARPNGVEANEFMLDNHRRFWEGRGMAAFLPAWDPLQISGNMGTYQPRYVDDGGRLFFDSPIGLVGQDVNGTLDTYEFEPVTDGGESPVNDSCSESSVTFVGVDDGCVGLVSSGTSPTESAFLDASESGVDVFFLTTAKLTSSDTDTGYDVYDAHVCGMSWACTSSASSSPTCESTSQCRAGSDNEEDVANREGLTSMALTGYGNALQFPVGSNRFGKTKGVSARQKKLAEAVASCRRRYRHSSKRRLECVAQARRRYAVEKVSKALTTGHGKASRSVKAGGVG